MKKFLLSIAVAAFFVSCSNAGNTESKTKDSLDSVENAKKAMIDSSAKQSKDSIGQSIDAKKEMADSMNKGKDTTKK